MEYQGERALYIRVYAMTLMNLITRLMEKIMEKEKKEDDYIVEEDKFEDDEESSEVEIEKYEKSENKNFNNSYEDKGSTKIKLKSDEIKVNKSLFDRMMASNQKNKHYNY